MVSESTKIHYDKIARRLINRLVDRELCSSIEEVATWIKKHAEYGQYRASTLRQYKAGLIHFLQDVEGSEARNALNILKETIIPNKVKGASLPKRTSAKKMKHISLEDERHFLDGWLPSRKSKLAEMLRLWLWASLNTGLRPSEWETAVYQIDPTYGPELIVQNAKLSVNRAHGPNRTLRLSGLNQDAIKAISLLIQRIQEHIETGASFKNLQKSMSNTIYRESRSCWPKRERHLSLYTMRHQFSANMKAIDIGRQELGALMGHATDRTASLHYARKERGREVAYHVTPLLDDVSRIKKKYSVIKRDKPKGMRPKVL